MAMNIDIIGGSYEQKYKDYNSQRTINYYVVIGSQQENNKSQKALYPMAGSTLFCTLPGRYFRGLFTARTPLYTRSFAVVDTTLYEILDNRSYVTRSSIANIGTGSSKIYMTCNASNQLGIFGYNASYYMDLTTNVVTQITTNQFPGNVKTADFMEGYTLVVSGGSVYFNSNNALQTWSLLNTYTPNFRACPTIAVMCAKDEVFNFASEFISVYINDGTSPFSLLPRSTVYIGLAARESLVKYNDGFIFLGRGNEGQTQVFKYDGAYTGLPIQDTSINWALNKAGPFLEDAYAHLEYTKDGHIFYRLTVPGLNTTYVLDVVTNIWVEQNSLQPGTSSDGSYNNNKFRGRHFTNFKGLNLFGDLYSGKVLIEDFTNQTEDGNPIIRSRTSSTFSESQQLMSVFNLEIDANTGYASTTGQGTDPILMLEVSTDGGYNYGQPRNIHLGLLGNHLYRARLNKLGSGRNWTLRLSMSDPVDIMIQNAIAKGSVSGY